MKPEASPPVLVTTPDELWRALAETERQPVVGLDRDRFRPAADGRARP